MAAPRLSSAARRDALLDVAAELFAAQAYDDVLMEAVAERGGVSRALLYRHFPSKLALFVAIYQRAADQLLIATDFATDVPLADQVVAGLDAHIDYFVANRNTVLAANRVLAGDAVIQAIISDELAVLRDRMLDASGLDGAQRDAVSAVLVSWLVFVRTLCVDWLANETCTRTELRDICSGALMGALGPLLS